MALVWGDCVADTSTTTGTGALTVSGTPTIATAQTFSAVCSTNDTFYGRVAHRTEAEWEEGLYTYSGTNEVTRTTVIKSSNSNNAVNFSAGTKDVTLVLLSSVISALLRSDATATLTAGYTATIYTGIGTITSGTVTPDPANGQFQSYTANGAHALNPPSVSAGKITILHLIVTNGASAGAITKNFNLVEGDDHLTTNAAVFEFDIYAENAYSRLTIRAR